MLLTTCRSVTSDIGHAHPQVPRHIQNGGKERTLGHGCHLDFARTWERGWKTEARLPIYKHYSTLITFSRYQIFRYLNLYWFIWFRSLWLSLIVHLPLATALPKSSLPIQTSFWKHKCPQYTRRNRWKTHFHTIMYYDGRWIRFSNHWLSW